MGLVYTIRNTINNKRYIGLTTKDNYSERLDQHIRDAKNKSKCHLHRAIRKYGWENFTHAAWYVSDDLEFLSKFEIIKIKEFDTFNNGYNMTSGGEGGYTFSEETKKKLSKSKLGNKNPMFGKILTKEHKKKLSKSHKGIIPWNKGIKDCFSNEWKQRMSKANKGKWTSINHSHPRKIILTHPDGAEEIFGCMRDACRKYNLNHGNLSQVARNKMKTIKGFKCKYVKETN